MKAHVYFLHVDLIFIIFFYRKAKQSVMPYVSDYYITQCLRDLYAGDVMPVPHPDDWSIPLDIGSKFIGVPPNPRQAGRPRVTRIRASSESSSTLRSRVCSRCHERGHNRSRCTTNIPTTPTVEVHSNPTSVAKPRRPKYCSNCSELGHTRVTCGRIV